MKCFFVLSLVSCVFFCLFLCILVIFVCNIDIAAKRRYKELKKYDPKLKLQNVKKALRIRNKHDINRKISPLLKHRDAIEIDTGKLNKQAMLVKMSKYLDLEIKRKYGN